MNFRALRTMVALAEHRSLTAAAEQLGLSHSAVSLQLRGLEEELGVDLVDRHHRPISLTAHGQAVVAEAREILDRVGRIRAMAGSGELVGLLRLGVVPSALPSLMPPALAALRAAHPSLQLQLRTGLSADLAQDIRGGSLDAAVLTRPDAPLEPLRTEIIGHEALVVLSPTALPQRPAEAMLRENPFIWFSRRTWAGQQIEQALARMRLRVETSMEVDSLDSIAALVEAGLGVAIAPCRIGAAPFGPGLRAQPFGTPQLSRSLVLLTREPVSRTPFAEALLVELRRIAGV